MGTRSRLPLALGAVVLLLCALVAATSTPTRWTGVELPWNDPVPSAEDTEDPPGTDEAGRASADEDSTDQAGRMAQGDLRSLSTVLLGVAVGLATTLVVVAVLRFQLVRRRARLTGRAAERAGAAPADPAPPEDADDALVTALDVGVRALDEGSPRNAIVAAWLRLEDAVTTEHFPRRPAETPTELVARALAAYRLDEEAIGHLAELYEEARFSRHPVTEAHRAEAGACLTRLLASMTGRPEEARG